MAPEDNPADDVQPTREEWEAYERQLEPISEFNPNHPHGPPDPQWIAPNGSCALCARTVAENERKLRIEAERERDELRKRLAELLPIEHIQQLNAGEYSYADDTIGELIQLIHGTPGEG